MLFRVDYTSFARDRNGDWDRQEGWFLTEGKDESNVLNFYAKNGRFQDFRVAPASDNDKALYGVIPTD